MKVLTGRVVGGRVEVGEDLAEGTSVAVMALGPEPVVLSEADDRELAEALTEIRNGASIDAAALVTELKALAGR